MISKVAALLATVAALAAAGTVPATAKTRAEEIKPTCMRPVEVSPTSHEMRCWFEGPGKYDIAAEASLDHGGPMGWAQMSILAGDEACGHSQATNFSGRGRVYGGCERRKFGLGRHDFTITVDYKDAAFGDVHVSASRRP